NADGSYMNTAPVGNPAAQFEYNSNNNHNNYRTVGNFFADVKFLQDFTFRSSMGFDYAFNDNKTFVPVFFVSPTQQNVNNSIDVGSNRTQNWLWENTLNYEKEWGNHRLTLLGGYTSQNFYFESLSGRRINLPGEDPALWYLNAGEETSQTNASTARDWSMTSILFMVNSIFIDRYLRTGTYRRDRASRFGRERRYGDFPSIALLCRFLGEGYMLNQNTF